MSRFFLIFLFLFVACRGENPKGATTPTSGQILVHCDFAVHGVIDSCAREFMRLYPKARVSVKPVTTQGAITDFLNRSVTCIVVTRDLDSTEKHFADRNNITVSSYEIAFDAMAFLVNSKNPISSLSMDELRRFWTGDITNWSSISPFDHRVELCIDSPESGNLRFLDEKILRGAAIPRCIVIVDSSYRILNQTLATVSHREGALAFLSNSWLFWDSYKRNSRDVKVLRISKRAGERSFSPDPAFVHRGDYPLSRLIRIIHSESAGSLASGFSAFLCGTEGQRIMLEAGAVPAVSPVRLKY